MKRFGIFKFITGVLIALALLFAGGAAVARYVITRLTAAPSKPIFTEEQVGQPSDSTSPDDSIADSQDTSSEPVQVFTDPVAPESELPQVEPSDTAANARITQPIGMVLRQGPSSDTTQIGSLYYNDEVILLGTSADGEWQNIRLPGSGVEGWIKAGNTEQLN
ncbi:MAG: SH3 domain-containing protein [Cyanobacteria bacterium J06626_14]